MDVNKTNVIEYKQRTKLLKPIRGMKIMNGYKYETDNFYEKIHVFFRKNQLQIYTQDNVIHLLSLVIHLSNPSDNLWIPRQKMV